MYKQQLGPHGSGNNGRSVWIQKDTHVENVFLDDGVEYDADEEVEEHGAQIFETGTICLQSVGVGLGGLVVLQGHEQRGQRRRDLQTRKAHITTSTRARGGTPTGFPGTGAARTWTMRPMTMTMATHDTMSAWFWMTNSWLSTGRFLFAADFLPLTGAIFLFSRPRESTVESETRRDAVYSRGGSDVRLYECVAVGPHLTRRRRCAVGWHPDTAGVAVALAVHRLLMCQYTCRRVYVRRDAITARTR